MGCAGGKEQNAVVQHGNIDDQHGHGRPLAPHEDEPEAAALRERQVELSNKRPQLLEAYWIAGLIDSNALAPHYVPTKGPLSIAEKLPSCPANLRRKIIVSLVPQSQSQSQQVTPMAVGTSSLATPESVVTPQSAHHPVPHNATSTPMRPPLGNLQQLMSTGKKRTASGMGITIIGIPSAVSSFPIPRFFFSEPHLPSSERVLLEAAEGRLNLLDGTSSAGSSDYHIRRSVGGNVPLLDAQALDNTLFRAHIVLPDDPFVARGFLPHSLLNYCVGWIKVPAAPVSFKRTVSANIDQLGQPVAVIRNNNDIQPLNGAGEFDAIPGNSTTPHGHNDTEIGNVGYLNGSKPVYNVELDGPVSQPFERSPSQQQDNQNQPNAVMHLMPRYLEKYFLYVKRVTSIGLTLSWKPAGEVDAGYQEVILNRSVTIPVRRQGSVMFDGSTPRGTQSTDAPNSARSKQTLSLSNFGSFFSFPVHEWEPLSSLQPGATGCLSLFHPAVLATETSFPLYLHTKLAAQFPLWFPKLTRLYDEVHKPVLPNCPDDDEQHNVIRELHDAVNVGVKGLSYDDIAWLAFRIVFNDWLAETTRQLQSYPQQQHPHLHSQNSAAAHIALKFGLKFQYDNQSLVAFNQHGRSNRVDGECLPGCAVAGDTQTGLMQFIDKTRPPLDSSKVVAESPVVVVSCRTKSNGLSGEQFVPPFAVVAEAEGKQLKYLFKTFLADVTLH